MFQNKVFSVLCLCWVLNVKFKVLFNVFWVMCRVERVVCWLLSVVCRLWSVVCGVARGVSPPPDRLDRLNIQSVILSALFPHAFLLLNFGSGILWEEREEKRIQNVTEGRIKRGAKEEQKEELDTFIIYILIFSLFMFFLFLSLHLVSIFILFFFS